MKPTDGKRIRDLLQRLERLDATQARPEEMAIFAVARSAIVEEMTRVLREEWLAVYRKGDVISVAV